jgi:hypothetical protein
MGCCNQKRAGAIAQPSRPSRPPTELARSSAASPASRVTVRYVGGRQIQVRGTVTGSVYHCSAANRMLSVSTRDAAALLRTGLFKLPPG